MINFSIKELKEVNIDWVDEEMAIGKSQNDNVFRILSYMASFFTYEIFLDLGTNQGASALALRNRSYDNFIVSYDILENTVPGLKGRYSNILFKIMDINKEHFSILKNSKLMYLDVDPHNGYQELVFINTLRLINYKGFVLCDDIHINHNMETFWKHITETKYDFSEFGHYTGTGLICFDEHFKLIKDYG